MARKGGKPRNLAAEALERDLCLNCTTADCSPTACPHRELLWGENGYNPRIPRTRKTEEGRIRLITKTEKTTPKAKTAKTKPVSITVPLPDAMEPQGEAARLWSAYVNRRFGVNVRFAPEDVKKPGHAVFGSGSAVHGGE